MQTPDEAREHGRFGGSAGRLAPPFGGSSGRLALPFGGSAGRPLSQLA